MKTNNAPLMNEGNRLNIKDWTDDKMETPELNADWERVRVAG